MLGEVWIPGQDVETGYTGITDPSATNLQYYRDKVREFQATLTAVDNTAAIMQDALQWETDDNTISQIQNWLSEYESKRGAFKTTAEAINVGAVAVNAAGGRFPQLSIPPGLGIAPIIIGAGLLGAIAIAAALITWGNNAISNAASIMRQRMIAETDPAAAAQYAARAQEIEAQQNASSGTGLSNIADIVKWGSFAVLGFMAFKAFTESRR